MGPTLTPVARNRRSSRSAERICPPRNAFPGQLGSDAGAVDSSAGGREHPVEASQRIHLGPHRAAHGGQQVAQLGDFPSVGCPGLRLRPPGIRPRRAVPAALPSAAGSSTPPARVRMTVGAVDGPGSRSPMPRARAPLAAVRSAGRPNHAAQRTSPSMNGAAAAAMSACEWEMPGTTVNRQRKTIDSCAAMLRELR